MFKSGLAASLALTFVVVMLLWVAGKAFGFHVSLVGSLAMSVGLTVLLSVILGAFSRRSRRGF